jgi:hypothetical protein
MRYNDDGDIVAPDIPDYTRYAREFISKNWKK